MAIIQKKHDPREGTEEGSSSEPSDESALDTEHADRSELVEPGANDLSVAQDESSEGPAVAVQLGVRKYVMVGFLVAGMLGAYIGSQFIFSVWAKLANKEWFARAVPLLAAVPDESKITYATIVAAALSVALVVRTYQRADIRVWSDDVASELARCKWPTKKEVTNYTTVVLIASALATSYLALLDRFYSFVTNLVYGNGS
jgi:preprotein translocase subunit SecE